MQKTNSYLFKLAVKNLIGPLRQVVEVTRPGYYPKIPKILNIEPVTCQGTITTPGIHPRSAGQDPLQHHQRAGSKGQSL